MRVLILGMGGNVSVGIAKCLTSLRPNIYILGAGVDRFTAGYLHCDEAIICPYAANANFALWLNKLVHQKRIDIVISGVEEINSELSKIDLETLPCNILCADEETLKIFSDKLKTANWLASNGIDAPTTILLEKDLTFEKIKENFSLPFIVKPRFGKGSANINLITNEDQFQKLIYKDNFIIQAHVGTPDNEYTCAVYKSTFGYTKTIIMRRKLKHGSTVFAEVIENETIDAYCRTIAKTIDCKVPFNIQLRLDNETLKPMCFEINMRLSGTVAIRHNFGFPDCVVWVKEQLLGKSFEHEFNTTTKFIATRSEQEIYFLSTDLEQLSQDTANSPQMFTK